MKKWISSLVIFIFLTGIVAALPNPAAVKCEEDGYKLDMRETELGTYGVCMFEDSECDEWEYFREECKPKQCSKVEGYVEDGNFKIKCEPYEEKGFMATFKKYFFLIFVWLWEEEETQTLEIQYSEDPFEKDLNGEEAIEI
ncbi:MAG: DUF333 domain-containing protein [Nanoarchaeota archaeon]|nr:DUF333 domain-containing protein [Nanoarchaeota archaeon]MCG2719017.1 DUF333 domain-containing protein [Nanoarchaeota archaeon]